ncbi:MAG: hypothetical protein N2578_10035, partial [Bdellovibrionaceae bacterium]|nr:hypothetical protein [Pseudobdellovibrionaceae bacterium]
MKIMVCSRFLFVVIPTISFTVTSCWGPSQSKKVEVIVKLPSQVRQSHQSVFQSLSLPGGDLLQNFSTSSTMSSPYWAGEVLQNLNDANCYMIYVKEPQSSGAECLWADNQTLSLGQIYGFYSAGAEVRLEVKA